MFINRWHDFTRAYSFECLENAKLQKQAPMPPNNFVRTYFTKEEAESRMALIMEIDKFQSNIKVDALNKLLQNIRRALTSNYKFTSVELLEHHISLLEKAKPKQLPVISAFRKSPDVQMYQDAISLLHDLLHIEKQRLGIHQLVNK
jgi:hypothetical protein